MWAVVDVDNILWNFYKHLSSILEPLGIPSWKYWNKWNFYKDYISDEEFYSLVDIVHEKIMPYEQPFKESKQLIDLLSNKYKIAIATHRNKKSTNVLLEWLDDHKIYHDLLYIGNDKTTLFYANDVTLVIDDSPEVIEKACSCGITTLTIEYQWNRHLKNDNLLFFNNLQEIIKFIVKEYM